MLVNKKKRNIYHKRKEQIKNSIFHNKQYNACQDKKRYIV